LILNKVGSRFRILWLALVESTSSFLDEAGFRMSLGYAVLRGRMPEPVAHRFWNRAVEVPTLLHVRDWTDDRTMVSVIIWPDTRLHQYELVPQLVGEAPEDRHEDPLDLQHRRVEEVMHVIARGATDLWHVRFEVDYGLRWVPERQAWLSSNGHLYHSSLGSIQHKKLRNRGVGVTS